MTSVNEAAGYDPTMEPALAAGLRTLSRDQIIPFTLYVRHVLPLDGYVFWLKTASQPVRGSVHVTSDKRQNEDETLSVNRIVFTTNAEVQAFNAIQPDQIWVGEVATSVLTDPVQQYASANNGNCIKFAFSRSGPQYKNAGLFHYLGEAVYPALQSQLIDVGSQLSSGTLIVSNSLPAWLALSTYNPVWLDAPNPGITLFPSFAVPDNLPPPYGVVHINPEATQPLQALPNLDAITTSQYQLASDNVRITLYGLTNDAAANFVNLVIEYSEDTDTFGIMGSPIIRDQKRTQTELGILAMKKTVTWDVSYFQSSMRTQARAIIEHATVAVYPQTPVAEVMPEAA